MQLKFKSVWELQFPPRRKTSVKHIVFAILNFVSLMKILDAMGTLAVFRYTDYI